MDIQNDATYFLTLQTETAWGRMLASFARWCAPPPGSRCLDVGCGPGLLPALLAQDGHQAIGADLDPAMFQPQPLHPNVLVADVLALPFPTASFELITASNVLFLLPDPAAALAALARRLAVGGQICLLNPSEKMSITAATALADENNLAGLARETLLNYAGRAERYQRMISSSSMPRLD